MKVPALLLLVLLTLTAFACSDDKPPEEPVDPLLTLNESLAATQSLTSFAFTQVQHGSLAALPMGLQLESATGQMETPDRISATLEGKAGTLSASLDFIGIGQTSWLTNAFTSAWEPLAGVTALDVINPFGLVTTSLQSLMELKLIGSEKVNGVSAHRFEATLASEVLAPFLPGLEPGRVLQVDLWISRDDKYSLKLLLKGPINATESPEIVREVHLSRFNQVFNIVEPQTSATSPAP